MGGCHFSSLVHGHDPFTGSGCGRSQQAYLHAATQIMAESVTRYANVVSLGSQSAQTVSLRCVPQLFSADGTAQVQSSTTPVYEANPACATCQQNVFDGLDEQHRLERLQWRHGPARVRLSRNEEAQMLLDRLRQCAYTVCKACVVVDVNQNQLIQASQLTSFEARGNTLFNNIFQDTLRSQLINNQDTLSKLAQALGENQSVESLTANLTTNLNVQSLNRIVRSVGSGLTASQSLVVNSSSGTNVSGLSQTQTMQSLSTSLEKDDSWLGDQNKSALTATATLVNQQTTLNDVGQVIFTSTLTLAKAIESVVFKVFLSIVGAIGAIVLGLAAYVLYRVAQKAERDEQVVDQYLDQYSQNDQRSLER